MAPTNTPMIDQRMYANLGKTPLPCPAVIERRVPLCPVLPFSLAGETFVELARRRLGIGRAGVLIDQRSLSGETGVEIADGRVRRD